MVAIRGAHLHGENAFVLEKWVNGLNVDVETADALINVYRHCQLLSDQDSLLPALISGREMVEILTTLSMDKQSLIAAFLFPFFSRHFISSVLVQEHYGDEILKLIDGVNEMAAISYLHTSTNEATAVQIDNVRRMLLSMVDDFRCVVIKLAERIAYLREVKSSADEIKLLAAKECANIYAPLANRLGIGQLKWELEDYAFHFQHAEIYRQIANQLSERRIDRELYIDAFVKDLQQAMESMNIKAQVSGRPKHIYSIWRKMQKKNLEFDELFDVRAVRIIADKIQDCYAALGIVHTKYRHLPNEFDDYVANPKPNGYQSIHTVVLGPSGKTVEIQIRTQQMHEEAELGVAAHWKYKEGQSSGRSGYDEKIAWLRKLLVWQEEISDSDEMLDELRSQVFDDRVYAFTPKGDVVDLPSGATPLDFAYYIHSEVGHRCIGAKVEGRIVPFTYQLQMGDQVEIITQKNHVPSRDWLNPNLGFITSGRARSKISAWFRKQSRDKNVAAGKDILDAELLKIGAKPKDAQLAVQRYHLNSIEDVYLGIGTGDLRINQVINFINSQVNKLSKKEEDKQLQKKLESAETQTISSRKHVNKGAVVVEGIDNLMTHIARCCQPIPGDDIRGYVTHGRGISVHRSDCEQLSELMLHVPERIIETVWGTDFVGQFQVRIRVSALDRSGLIKDITTVIANEKIKVSGLQTRSDYRKNTAHMDFTLELTDLSMLSRISQRLEQIKDVVEVKRLH